MEKKSRRIARVNELIKEEIAKIIRDTASADNVLTTVILCETTPNLRSAKIILSVMPPEKGKAVLKNIQKNIFDIQQELNKTLKMRPVPKISFELSGSGKQIKRLDKIFRELNLKENDGN